MDLLTFPVRQQLLSKPNALIHRRTTLWWLAFLAAGLFLFRLTKVLGEEAANAKILQLVQDKIARVQQGVCAVALLLGDGRTEEAASVLRNVNVDVEDLKRANSFAQKVMEQSLGGCSLLKVRIHNVRIGPDFIIAKSEAAIERGEKKKMTLQAWLYSKLWRFGLKFALLIHPKFESIDAKVVEVHTTGTTMRGLLSVPRRREDLFPGGTIRLERDHNPRRPFAVGSEYWVIISPLASRRPPFMLFGGGTTSRVFLDEPAA